MNGSASLRNRLNTIVRDIPRSGIRDFFDIVSTMKDVISLGIGEPDFDTPWHVRESTVFALERGATHYTSNLGYLELRRALARYVRKAFGADHFTCAFGFAHGTRNSSSCANRRGRIIRAAYCAFSSSLLGTITSESAVHSGTFNFFAATSRQ